MLDRLNSKGLATMFLHTEQSQNVVAFNEYEHACSWWRDQIARIKVLEGARRRVGLGGTCGVRQKAPPHRFTPGLGTPEALRGDRP